MNNLILGASGKIGSYLIKNDRSFIYTYNSKKIKGGIKFNFLKNDISKIERDLKINDQNQLPILLVRVHKDGYSGKVISKRMLGISSFEIPYMKKNLEGIANIFLDNGLTINLKVFEKASLKLIGGFGKISLQGKCLPFID